MSEPIAGVGYLAGICAHDGTGWQKLKIDAEGRLEVVVTAGHEYVDRGDPAAVDFTKANLTLDATWRDLDLSGVVTDSDAVLVHMRVIISSAVTGSYFGFRKNGNVNAANTDYLRIANTAVPADQNMMVALDENLIAEYYGIADIDTVSISIRGWWRPAA